MNSAQKWKAEKTQEMTAVLLYWRDYKENWIRQFAGERAYYWHSSAKLLDQLQPGDHLWMVTSGANIKHEVKQVGFLVAIWTVKETIENPGDDPAYPRDDYRFRVIADPADSIVFGEPILVDHLLRPEGRDKAVSIGRFLQGPRKLGEQKVRLLRAAAGPELALNYLKSGGRRTEGGGKRTTKPVLLPPPSALIPPSLQGRRAEE